ncbi:MAG: sulfatase-like hydrolase/transferase [Bacteroidota bacterium]
MNYQSIKINLILTYALLSWLILLPTLTYAQTTKLPNILLLLADDLGYAELGCQGNTDIPTPHIDSLAANGIRFTQGYVCNSYCSPSRAGLLTGRYPHRFGYESNLVGYQNDDPNLGLPLEEESLAEYLLESGYVSGIIGKWHQGGRFKYHPYRQGFDEFFGFLHEGHYFVPPPHEGVTTMLRRKVLPGGGEGRWISADRKMIYSTHMGHNEPDYDANNPILRGSHPVLETAYLTDALTREAVDFIDRHQDKPFFLYVAYNAVHSPLQGADAYMNRFADIPDIHRRIFAAMLANLDDSVGEIVDKLRKEGLEENTLIVFLSDNGGPTKELTSSNLPLRGGKGGYYEGGIRIPFIMQWKKQLPRGEVYQNPIISLDLFPTFAAAANRPTSSDRMDGVNLLPFLENQISGNPHPFLFWSFKGKMALRKVDWKIVRNSPQGSLELYDLSKDLQEQNDLAEKHPEIVQELFSTWKQIKNP